MNVITAMLEGVQFISEGVTRVFRPNDDQYPETGVQPFEGEPFSKWVELANDKSSRK